MHGRPKSQLPEFDILVDLAENAPERLETLRRTMVEQVIEGADATQRRRLQGLQAQIDLIRRGSPNPLAACVRISSMMCDSLAEMRRTLVGEDTKVRISHNGSIIPFPTSDR